MKILLRGSHIPKDIQHTSSLSTLGPRFANKLGVRIVATRKGGHHGYEQEGKNEKTSPARHETGGAKVAYN
jgi:hypothetical protein